MSEKYVVRLKNAAIYHADNPFGSTSAEKLMRRGEMVLSDVNLCVAPGEFVYLIGRVGSGKSTLLKTLYAEVQLLSGEGRVAGYDLRRLRRRDIPYLRRRIGIVFQDYQLLTDRNVRVEPHMLRFLRRAMRDSLFRSSPVEYTLKQWNSVRRGERLYISPYRGQADLTVDTYLPYETNILMQYLSEKLQGEEKLLEQADLAPLSAILDKVSPIDYKPYMPEDSVLHEFIG